MNDQRLRVSDISQKAEELQRVDEAFTCLEATLDTECDQRSSAIRQVPLCQRVILARREAGLVYPFDSRVRFEVLGDSQGVLRVALHAKVKGLRALQEQE